MALSRGHLDTLNTRKKIGLFCNKKQQKWNIISPNLSAWKKELGLSTKEAARLLGMSPRAFDYFQSGEHVTPWSVLLAAEFIYHNLEDAKRLAMHRDGINLFDAKK